MKNDRHIAQGSGKNPVRREWPHPADLSPARGSTVAAATRGPAQGLNEPPVRPVPGWRLPSGQLLVEYALRAGLASSPLLVRLPLLGGGSLASGRGFGSSDGAAPSLVALAGALRNKPGVNARKVAGKTSRDSQRKSAEKRPGGGRA
jgi:hypothetical protein